MVHHDPLGDLDRALSRRDNRRRRLEEEEWFWLSAAARAVPQRAVLHSSQCIESAVASLRLSRRARRHTQSCPQRTFRDGIAELFRVVGIITADRDDLSSVPTSVPEEQAHLAAATSKVGHDGRVS